MRRLVVIGGGISGLAAAWAARAADVLPRGELEILVLERDGDVGGKARSIASDGWLVECGPTGFLAGRPELDRLIASTGLTGELRPAAALAARRYVFLDGRMRRIAANPLRLLGSGALSARAVIRLLAEVAVPAAPAPYVEESVWQFAARRLGVDVADRLVGPMALGVFAGDANRLSLPAAFPKMAALELEHGSLLRGLLARRGRMLSGALTSFRDGMQALPRALAASGSFEVRCRAEVRRLVRTPKRWDVIVSGSPEPLQADAVVLAGDAPSTARLMRPLDESLAADLDRIACPSVAVVALGYGPEAGAAVPTGFGLLVRRGEGIRMLGNLWDSQLFQGRSPEGHLLMRAMYGGRVDPAVCALDDEELLELARDEVARLYGITAAPRFSRVIRWPHAIPQYELGHLDRVARIEERSARIQDCFLAGSALHGAGFADAAASGLRAGAAAAEALARQASGTTLAGGARRGAGGYGEVADRGKMAC